jgi:hypothetical protein
MLRPPELPKTARPVGHTRDAGLSGEVHNAADGHRRYRVPLGPLSRSARCRDHQSVGKRRASLLLGANGSESLGAEPIIVTNWVEELEARVK